jgi:hypothetical protein
LRGNRIAFRERVMKSHGHAPVGLTKQFAVEERRADQEQLEDAAAKMGVRHHPFDWWDFLLFVMPIATIVLGMWLESE